MSTRRPERLLYAGIDGCRQGWVALLIGDREELIEGFRDLEPLIRELASRGATTFAVDMPIDPPDRGQRACDLAVQRRLGSKRSSLFITPTRAALTCRTQAEASEVNRGHGGQGVSAQAFALRHKIAEVERVETPMIEVHPELSFHLLGDVRFGKRTWAGVRERVAVLEAQGLHPHEWASAGWAATDDTLDAAVAAVSARRFAEGIAMRFPPDEPGPHIWA